VGKTRLALQAAGQVSPRFGDGAWLCELAPVRDPAAVDDAVAADRGRSDHRDVGRIDGRGPGAPARQFAKGDSHEHNPLFQLCTSPRRRPPTGVLGGHRELWLDRGRAFGEQLERARENSAGTKPPRTTQALNESQSGTHP